MTGPDLLTAILLAAGSSKRMGNRNKLLMPVEGKALVRVMIERIQEAGLRNIIVVLGHEADAVKRALAGTPCRWVTNPDPDAGMGRSLAEGIRHLTPGTAGVLALPADLPHLPAAFLRRLVDTWLQDCSAERIVATRSAGIVRGPAVFGAAWFEALAALTGDDAGRTLLKRNDTPVVPVDCPDPAWLHDWDRPEDLD
ncbi:MAG: nucleotidyltransferase family protein [Opitutales bacterium]